MNSKLILLFFLANTQRIESSIFNLNTCTLLKPMNYLNYTKVSYLCIYIYMKLILNDVAKKILKFKFLGEWFYYASSSNYIDVDLNCLKKTYLKHDDNTLYYEKSYIEYFNDTFELFFLSSHL
jgi:hypothetical protein